MPDKILPKFVAYYQQDFAASARMNRNLDWLQRHIYRTLCLEAPFCETRPYLPHDEAELAFLADVPEEVWAKNRDAVLRMFRNTTLGYTHPRIEREYEKAAAAITQRKKAGRLGGLAKAADHLATAKLPPTDTEQEIEQTRTESLLCSGTTTTSCSVVENQPQSGFFGYSYSTIMAHYQKLLDSGQPWVCGEGRDGYKRMTKGWVEHIMSLEPKKRKTKPVGGYRLAQTCSCGRPKPCEVHNCDLGDDLNEK